MKYAFYGDYGEIQLPANYCEENPDFVLSFGGDGTMLQAIHKYVKQLSTIKFIGINTGKLGFYTDFITEDINMIFALTKSGKYDLFKIKIMEYELILKQDTIKGYAINDMALINPVSTQVMDVYINDRYFETIRGTGLLVSPPGGSTAYNRSLGGSIIDPWADVLQMTEVAPINNRIFHSLGSPLVLSGENHIELRPASTQNLYLTVDGREISYKNLTGIKITLSKASVSFVIKQDTSFFDRLQKAFLE